MLLHFAFLAARHTAKLSCTLKSKQLVCPFRPMGSMHIRLDFDGVHPGQLNGGARTTRCHASGTAIANDRSKSSTEKIVTAHSKIAGALSTPSVCKIALVLIGVWLAVHGLHCMQYPLAARVYARWQQLVSLVNKWLYTRPSSHKAI